MAPPPTCVTDIVFQPQQQEPISNLRFFTSMFFLVLTLCTLLVSYFLLANPVMATGEPEFHLSFQEGAFEVRDYPSLIAAEVTVTGERREAATAGFKLLAGYIFGANQRREKVAATTPPEQSVMQGETIAMTAPVTQTQASPGGKETTWVIRFVMPSRYALSDLPVPTDKRVTLKTLPPQRFAVHRFSGLAHEADVEENTSTLKAFAAKRQLLAIGLPSLARYDPPWRLWFLRRNEILLPIEGLQAP